ncbi:cupin domain-containing protein [Beijerinckia sp. L45]|uniref:cupin domain-containing protein n=1 Tax=Beijerinckia sp. L45 TaxID=1641855 RepID=UPI00131C4AB0|nr:cupin domain-containing protein [Beijerinckia sp. L45]
MLINDDLTRPAIVHGGQLDWIPSPTPGVDRRMLFRIGEEKARATSIVRYAPDSRFPRHVHGGGEEFVVLDGVFQDDHGDYPAGSYIRNPPGSAHAPASKSGCSIFVRLWQFRQDDHALVVQSPEQISERPTAQPGVTDAVLFDDGVETVLFATWTADTEVWIANPNGLELLVLQGSFDWDDQIFAPQSWMRLPAGRHVEARSGPHGTRVWLKRGPLLHPDVCAFDR